MDTVDDIEGSRGGGGYASSLAHRRPFVLNGFVLLFFTPISRKTSQFTHSISVQQEQMTDLLREQARIEEKLYLGILFFLKQTPTQMHVSSLLHVKPPEPLLGHYNQCKIKNQTELKVINCVTEDGHGQGHMALSA